MSRFRWRYILIELHSLDTYAGKIVQSAVKDEHNLTADLDER